MRAGPAPGRRRRGAKAALARHATHADEKVRPPRAADTAGYPVPIVLAPPPAAPPAAPPFAGGPFPGGPFPGGPFPGGPAGYGPVRLGLDPAGYDPAGYDPAGYDPAGYDPAGYDPAGYDPAGYDPADDPGMATGVPRDSLTASALADHRLSAPYRADSRSRDGSHVHTVDGNGLHRTPHQRRSAAGGILGALTEVVVVVALALVLALVVKTFLVQAFFIPSGSMERTLLVGDRVLVSHLTPGPFDLHRGDVVVFKDPGGWLPPALPPDESGLRGGVRRALTFVGLLPQDSGEHLIKRVIGLPGDQVVCCDADGLLSVNGVPVTEPYLGDDIAPSSIEFDITVPPGRLWVMGDNRPSSEDSRYHTMLSGGGSVPIEDVVGQAFVIVWPLARAGLVGGAGDAFAAVPGTAGAR